MEHFDLTIIGTGSGNSIPDPGVDPRYARHAGRDLRAGHVRRHLPQRRLHPDQDVRLRRRGRRDHPRQLAFTVSTRPSTRSAGPTSSRGCSAASTRSPRAARSTSAACPTSTCTRSHTRFGPTQPDGRYTLRTEAGDEFTSDQVVIAAGSRIRVPPAIARLRCRLPHQRHRHADPRAARASGDRRRRLRGRGVRARVLRARRARHHRGARRRPAHPLRRVDLPPVHRHWPRTSGICAPTRTSSARTTTAIGIVLELDDGKTHRRPTCSWSPPGGFPTATCSTPSWPASRSTTTAWSWSTSTNAPRRVASSRSATCRRPISSSTSPTTRCGWCATTCCWTGTTPRRWSPPTTASCRRRCSPTRRSPWSASPRTRRRAAGLRRRGQGAELRRHRLRLGDGGRAPASPS